MTEVNPVMRGNIVSEHTIYIAPSNNEQIHIKSEAVTAEIDLNGVEYSASSGGNLEYCRLCANQTDSPVNIFDSEVTDKCLNMNLYEKLVTYFPIIISKDDQLPKSVCPVCLAKVEVTLQFNQQIVNSHKFFLAKFKVTDSIQPPQPQLVHDNDNGGDSKDPLAPLVDGNKGMPASLLPSYLKRLTVKGGGGGSVVLGGGKKRKKKRYLLMEVEDDPSAKRQVYKLKKRFIPSLTTCALCGLKSDTSKANLEHWASTHPDRIIEYKCFENGCEFVSTSIMKIKLHTKEHMYKEGLMDQCPSCAKYFPKRQMKAHLAVHNDGQQYSCKECGKTFKFKSGLQTHEKTHDPNYNQNIFTCAECGKEYNMKHQYDAHMRRHTEVQPYRCEVCLKSFWSPHDLQYHETIHTGVRPYKCTDCDMSFARELDRKKHHAVKHTEPNKYACSICPVKYNRKDQLLVHELNHRGETPFKCQICSKGFTRKDKLTRHMDVHVTDDSKYRFSCHLCGKRYTQSGSLFTHMKNSHNGVQ